jgi:hypothetical protein
MANNQKPKLSMIKVYVSPETKEKAFAKYGNRNVSYAVNKLIQKNLKEK